MDPAWQISWQAFLRVKDERAAAKLVGRIEHCLRLAVEVDVVEQYWKDSALFRCRFSTPLPRGGADAIRQLIGRLAPRWEIGGSLAARDLNGVSTENIKISGVTWLHFDVVGVNKATSLPPSPQ